MQERQQHKRVFSDASAPDQSRKRAQTAPRKFTGFGMAPKEELKKFDIDNTWVEEQV